MPLYIKWDDGSWLKLADEEFATEEAEAKAPQDKKDSGKADPWLRLGLTEAEVGARTKAAAEAKARQAEEGITLYGMILPF